MASGYAEIRARAEARFAEPDLDAQLLKRVVMGELVIDQESVVHNFSEGFGRMDLIGIYQVRVGKIVTASLVFAAKTLGTAELSGALFSRERALWFGMYEYGCVCTPMLAPLRLSS